MLIWIVVFCGLRIDLAVLETAEHFLESNGSTGALVQADGPTFGEAESFLKASHITPTRRAHQVAASISHQSLEEAHQEPVKSTESNTEPMSLEDWCTVQQETQPMFKF